MKLSRMYVALFICLSAVSCSPAKKINAGKDTTIDSLHFLGEYVLPHNMLFSNTTVGGLSGIDYDAKNDLYYLISDDRSAINPARFYTARIHISTRGIDSVRLMEADTLFQKNGSPYPNSRQNASATPDPESIRLNPATRQLIWSSEGERIVKKDDTILENPSITIISAKGKYIDTFPLPYNLHMQASERGPRQNSTLEGLTWADNYNTLYASMEEPLYEDGPRADIQDNNPLVRIYAFDMTNKKNIAQYAYKLAPVAYAPNPPNSFKINGISDILSVNKHQLLVTERSSSNGKAGFFIKVFLADISHADNMIRTASFSQIAPKNIIDKKLLLNMESLPLGIDNIEGATFGPRLSNGHNTLIFISDNNFNPLEKTQILLFEVFP